MNEDYHGCRNCDKWGPDVNILCPVCEGDYYCSQQCMWSHMPQCVEYATRKDDAPTWTPRSLMSRIFLKIRQDTKLQETLRARGRGGSLVFYTQDLTQLATLLSSAQDWKEILINGSEYIPGSARGHNNNNNEHFIFGFSDARGLLEFQKF